MKNNKDNPSHSLEVISREAKGARLERRNLPRLSLTSEQFRISRSGKIYSVMDLSQSGMGFWLLDPKDIQLFSVGLLLDGTLNLRREKFSVKARIRNLQMDRVGCEFEDLSQATSQALSQFLDPAGLGAELKPIPSAVINTLWYHGPSGTDLILHRSLDGQYQKFVLYVLGSYVQWESERGMITGRTEASQERSEIRGILRFETLLLNSDPEADPGKLSIAKTVILSSNLPQDLKSWCVRQFERI